MIWRAKIDNPICADVVAFVQARREIVQVNRAVYDGILRAQLSENQTAHSKVRAVNRHLSIPHSIIPFDLPINLQRTRDPIRRIRFPIIPQLDGVERHVDLCRLHHRLAQIFWQPVLAAHRELILFSPNEQMLKRDQIICAAQRSFDCIRLVIAQLQIGNVQRRFRLQVGIPRFLRSCSGSRPLPSRSLVRRLVGCIWRHYLRQFNCGIEFFDRAAFKSK